MSEIESLLIANYITAVFVYNNCVAFNFSLNDENTKEDRAPNWYL